MILANNNWGASFFISSLLFGVALAIDAFSVSLADSFADPKMKRGKFFLIAGTFGLFQGFMPLIGYGILLGIGSIPGFQDTFNKIVPFVALVLLCYLGIKMIVDYSKDRKKDDKELVGDLATANSQEGKITKSFVVTLLVQGVATSIDALSVGFSSVEYDFIHAFTQSMIIAVMTFGLCAIALVIGKKAGTKIGVKAMLIGGIILILIGVFICTKGILKYYCNIPLPEWL